MDRLGSRTREQLRIFRSTNINNINTRLLKFCYEIQDEILGRYGPRTQVPLGKVDLSTVADQSIAASISLFKEASRNSRANRRIVPTKEGKARGVDIATENLDIFKKR